MNNKDFANVPKVWEPKENSGEEKEKFRKFINQKYQVKIENTWDLHQWSVQNVPQFWEEIWKMGDFIHSQPYESVLEYGENADDPPKWFNGARVNIAENILRIRDDQVALYVSGEERATKRITFSEVYKESCRYGASFKKLGLKKNDCVVCYMPNREEPYFCMLGATSIGAIWSGSLPYMGAKAVLNRFKQVNPKFLFTIDRFVHDGEEKDLLQNLKEIAEGLPSLQKVIIVPSRPESRLKNISAIKNSCFIDEFLSMGEDTEGNVPDLIFEQLPFDHPVYISYTSGTTGDPKPLVHGFGSLVCLIRDMKLHYDTSRETVFLSMSPVGWASWNIFLHMLYCGAAIVVYEGMAYYKNPTSLWDLVDEFKITNLFLTPSVLDELEKRGYTPGPHNHLTSLKSIMAGASVVKPKNFDFVFNKVKSDTQFGSGYGSTEFMGAIMVSDGSIPIYRGEISMPAFGVQLSCLDDEGHPVIGELGELVTTTPMPSMPLGLWGDVDGKLYRKNYRSKYPGCFSTGDLAYVNPVTKGVVVCCRSDDTLKPKGCRFGSSEIYNIVNVFPEVMDSLCVSQYNRNKDERAVLFLQMKNGLSFSEDLVNKIRQAIEKELSKRHVPEKILSTPDIPYNMNGKKMEIIVKKILNHMSYNSETIDNPECLKYFHNHPDLQDYY